MSIEITLDAPAIFQYSLKYGKDRCGGSARRARPGEPARRLPATGRGRTGGNARRRDCRRARAGAEYPHLSFRPPACNWTGHGTQGWPLGDLRGTLRNHERAHRLSHGKLLPWRARRMRAGGLQTVIPETGKHETDQHETDQGGGVMKRMHVHVAVEDIPNAIGFYSALFATAPAVVKPDYAKWMLDDPRVNFAISTRGRERGLDHLGIQVESQEELQDVY